MILKGILKVLLKHKIIKFIWSLPELYQSKSNVSSISKDVLGLVSSAGDFPEKSTYEKNSIIDG